MRRTDSGLLVEEGIAAALGPVRVGEDELTLHPGHLTPYGRMWLAKAKVLSGFPMAGGGGKSQDMATKVLNHAFNDGTWTVPTTPSLALCTVVPDATKTGTTITEATYTGYVRLAITAADMAAAVAGAPSSKTNSNALTFAACTAGSSTIIGYAVCDAATVGNVIYWGSATSTVISTTQTPATVPISGLSATEA